MFASAASSMAGRWNDTLQGETYQQHVNAIATFLGAGSATIGDVGQFLALISHMNAGPNAYMKMSYLAGTDQARAQDVMSTFQNDSYSGLIINRGGYGVRLSFSYIPPPKILIACASNAAFLYFASHPKVVIGFALITPDAGASNFVSSGFFYHCFSSQSRYWLR